MIETRLFLIRHGETNANVERRLTGWVDAPLSERGFRQVRAAGRAIAAYAPIAGIYTSDLCRAHATAQIIADATGYPHDKIRPTSDLREHSHGVLDGLTFKEAEREHPEVWRALTSGVWDFAAPEGESNAAVAARVGRALEAALQHDRGGAIVVVSHILAITHMLRLLLEIPQEAYGRVAFRVSNGGIHRLHRRNDKIWFVETLNDTSHLVGLE